jgi:anti-sigma regulatory factor (Ser/Thr protein kinase)
MLESKREYLSDPCRVCDMRAFIREGCRQFWIDPEDDVAIGQLELAVSEAAGNIILHGHSGRPGQPIELALTVNSERACVTFHYPGCDFDPQSVPPPTFDAASESGYGLYLIQQSVDEVQYSRDETGRCAIRLLKNRKLPH